MALSSIIDSSNKRPGTYVKVSLGVGAQSAAAAALSILVFGNKTSAGSKAASSIDAVYSVDDAIAFYGQGSELHRMIRNLLRVYPTAKLFGAVILESVGVNASLATLTFTGTATATGVVEVFIAGERVTATFASGDTATTLGNAVRDAINNNPDLPVTATATTGTVTITAKHKGPRGNFIRVYNTITTGSGYTHTPIDAYLASGATSDSPANAIDASNGQRWDLMVLPYSDSTNVALFKTATATNASPTEGRRNRYVYGSQDTLANFITVQTAINDARGRGIWHYNSDVPPAEFTASFAGRYVAALQRNRAVNLDGITIPAATPQRVLADRPIGSEIISALNSGITALEPALDGTVRVTRAITTRFRNDAGTASDYSVLDVSKVDVPDAVADQLIVDFDTQFSTLRDDGTKEPFRLANDTEGEVPPPGVATPATIRDFAIGVTKRFDAESIEGSAGSLGAYLVNVDENAPNIVAEIDANAPGRVNLSVPVDVVEGLHQLAADVRQIG